MRLRSATIEGFRGFTKKVFVDLDANVIILQGPNGVGKTSLLDAILWVLTGRIDRFGEKGNPISLKPGKDAWSRRPDYRSLASSFSRRHTQAD